MEPISRQELAKLSLDELRGLLRRAFNALATFDASTPEYRSVSTNLEAIQQELRSREP